MARYLVDITRSISRIGRGFATGIDRVETEYVRFVLKNSPDSLFVAKAGQSYVLLNADTVTKILANIKKGEGWGLPTAVDTARLKLSWQQRCARSFIMRNALKTVSQDDSARLFKGVDLVPFEYLNIGHSNLSRPFFQSLRDAGCKTIRVFVHDMIPLDFPAYAQPHIPAEFEAKMKAAAAFADNIICNSEATRTSVERYFKAWGASPAYTVSHLGIEPLKTDTTPNPTGHPPYFVVLGTIEPRKNHQLLFDVWEKLADILPEKRMPHLYVIGRRGWRNAAVFKVLDTSPMMGKFIFEKPDVSDRDLAIILQNATALLFPSFAEGYGLPALEAAQMNSPVLCSDIAVFHEILQGYAQFLAPNDALAWCDAVLGWLENPELRWNSNTERAKTVRIPSWEAHFRHVFRRS